MKYATACPTYARALPRMSAIQHNELAAVLFKYTKPQNIKPECGKPPWTKAFRHKHRNVTKYCIPGASLSEALLKCLN